MGPFFLLLIDFVFRGEFEFVCGSFCKNIYQSRMLIKRHRFRPAISIQIEIHQELSEAQKSERDLTRYPPIALVIENLIESLKILLWSFVFFQQRNIDIKVPPHLLDQRKVRVKVISRVLDLYAAVLFLRLRVDKLHRDSQQWGVANLG